MKRLVLLFLLFSKLSYAVGEGAQDSITDIVQSGRDYDVLKLNQEAVKKVDEALDLLGVSRTSHRLEFVPSGQLPHLAIMGRPAVGHWHDGSVIATQARSAMGVLEFVTPGCPTCRSFYSDSTTPAQQIEIFKHVGGHNDFSLNSVYCKIRQPCDMIASAQQLYEMMEEAYKKHDFDEVSQWYQFLSSLGSAQDFARGTFDPPEYFIRDQSKSTWAHPKNPTPHELQFLVTNLPSEVPTWKKDIAVLFERMERMKGYMVSTKIMNEGWATFLQDFLVPYLPWHDDTHLIESAELKTGVAYPQLSNPYWLGREAWRNLYKQFKKLPPFDSMSPLERDREFVKYAHRLMGQMGDYDFLKMALTEDWVAEHHLYLYRKAEGNEVNPQLPEPEKENQEQKIVVSTQAKDIAEWIAKKIADRSLQIPRIHVENVQATGRNVFSLKHEVIEEIPLQFESIAPSLYVRSQIWQRPVSLKTRVPTTWLKGRRRSIELFPIRIEVDPKGSVQAFHHKEESETLEPELSQKLQASLDAYLDELEGSSHEQLEEEQFKRFAPMMSKVADTATDASMNLVSHSMSSATAVLRYYEMIERRLYHSIKKSLEQKARLKRTKNGVRIKILPTIPEFELDQNFRRMMEKSRISVQLPQLAESSRLARSLFELVDLNLGASFQWSPLVDIGAGESTPKRGDRFWGDADPEGSGSGQGDENDEEDEEGEEGDEESGGEAKPGKGKPQDPSEIEIPLSLIGEFLKEKIQLPHLRPKAGATFSEETERDGAKNRSYGEILWNRVVPKALVLGEIAFRKKGKDVRSIDRRELLKEGMKYIQPNDWVVPSEQKTLRPDVNAVIVFWMDLTGSMMGKPVEMAKQFVFNLKALLSTKYKNITFRYVGFSDNAIEFPSEFKFFKAFIGGGTNYASGIKKTLEIMEEYNPTAWDRYSFGIGDAEDQNPAESSELLRELVELTQYTAFVMTDVGGFPDPTFLSTLKALEDEDRYFGFAKLTPQGESPIETLRKLLGNSKSD